MSATPRSTTGDSGITAPRCSVEVDTCVRDHLKRWFASNGSAERAGSFPRLYVPERSCEGQDQTPACTRAEGGAQHLRFRKLKCVIIFPNWKKIQSKGGLDDTQHTFIDYTWEQNISFHVCCQVQSSQEPFEQSQFCQCGGDLQ